MSVLLPILRPDEDRPEAVPPEAPATAHRAGRLIDAHGRVIHDLRLSVTDRCNYRCTYCMDPGIRYLPKRNLLSLDEYLTVARVCQGLGIRKIRVTGGEPTLYPHLDDLLVGLGLLRFEDVAMTTNGSTMTAVDAARWGAAGLRRVTFSLDSLRPDRVGRITRSPATPQTVIGAIEAARAAALEPIKVNAVIIRGTNDDEIADFADFARAYRVRVRLIEFMPLDSSGAWDRSKVVPAAEMLQAIRLRHDLRPVAGERPDSTSCNFSFADGAPGGIGLIASVTRPFCGACSRLRITADGKVRPCLFSHDEWDLRPLLLRGAHERELSRFLVDALWTKQAGHRIGAENFQQPRRTMSAIGG